MIRVLYVDSDTDAIKRIYTDWHNDEIQLEDVACSGDEAIAFLKQKDYDIMVLDLVLKGIDGFAVLTVAEKLCKSTQVIILTAAMNGWTFKFGSFYRSQLCVLNRRNGVLRQ